MLQNAIQGARHAGQQITWLIDGVTPLNLTGATLSGTTQNPAGEVRAIDGTLAIATATSGIFTWSYGAADTATAGEFVVQFKASFSQYELSLAEYWKVIAVPVAAFPFTYDLTTPVGQIRLEIGDTVQGTGNGVKPPGLDNFSNDELTHFYSSEGSVLAAAARACEVLARMWARSGTAVRIRDYSIDSREKAKEFRELAKELRQRSGTLFASGSAPTTKVDGYSSDVSSQEVEGPGEYYSERKELRWP